MGTGSRQRHISQSQASLWGNVPGGNNRGGTFRAGFSGGEYTGHIFIILTSAAGNYGKTLDRHVHRGIYWKIYCILEKYSGPR